MNKLDEDFNKSVLRRCKQGVFRYYPTSYKIKKGNWIEYVLKFIFFDRVPSSYELMSFLLMEDIHSFVERFDGKLWVRSDYKSCQHFFGCSKWSFENDDRTVPRKQHPIS